ncbi:eCIS core domain-containing protein [Pseudogemmobacter bohemicus]|uniref:eCIS core domain-containing protein n=1 Tax=Pseudogemmobacter bohemicus TaxID=2250708 RepID=UPI000DD4DA52|nr:DUF4157 domain-containing protein [Pseudogemmobacter bohemicus]
MKRDLLPAMAHRPAAAALPASTRAPARPASAKPAPAKSALTRPAFAPGIASSDLAAGREFPASLRSDMEGRFGTPLPALRLHDGAAGDTLAAKHGARALTHGADIAFAAGAFRPDTDEGRGLIAHELAHALQQQGDKGSASPGPASPGSAETEAAEAEAEAAVRSAARGERPAIRQKTAKRVMRAARSAAAPAGLPAGSAQAAPTPPSRVTAPARPLPANCKVITDTPAGLGTDELVIELQNFAMPKEKGMGAWVRQAYTDAAAGGRLVFSPEITGNSIAAWKEGGEKYKDIWLGHYGFATTADVKKAFTTAAATNEEVKTALTDTAVKKVVDGLGTNLTKAGCDIDHIVEKQIGGTSIPSNMQLLDATKNRESGASTYNALVDVVREIRSPAMRGDKVKNIQLRIPSIQVPAGTTDASFVIETLLRKGAVAGSEKVKTLAGGTPVHLSAGGQGEAVQVKESGETPITAATKRIVPGMRLTSYKRGANGRNSVSDTVTAELDSRAMRMSSSADASIKLKAVPHKAPASAEPGAEPSPVTEARQLKFDGTQSQQKIPFYYPYLSPGVLTKLALDDTGGLIASGTITPSIPLLPKLDVEYAKDVLSLIAPIPAAKLVSPLPGAFRFTGGKLEMQLSPSLVPSGDLDFEIGPAGKPLLRGGIHVEYIGGVFIAKGSLVPAGKIPGISAADGEVLWKSDTGWSGRVKAASSSIPKSEANVEIGFREEGGGFSPYASGAITTRIRDATLTLGAGWKGQGISYYGEVDIPKPLPMVDSVKLKGRYSDAGLWLEGKAGIKWRSIDSTITIGYARKPDEEEGRFSGKADVEVKTEKASGIINLSFDEQGNYWGKGQLSYQVTKTLRPTLGVELTRDRRVKLFGEVAVSDIPLSRKWPNEKGGQIDIIRSVGVKFSIPTPVPAVTAYGEIRGSLGLGYGVGPVMLKSVKFNGELYPLEDDPQVKAKLTGAFSLPAYGEIYGTFGAYIGLEVALGAVGAKGGIEITPALRIEGEGGLDVEADYDRDGFAFSAEAFAKGRLIAKAKVDLAADLYAAWGAFSHRWVYNVAAVQAQIGPEVKLTLGRIAYSKAGDITWPSLSQIKMEPEKIDPMQVVREMMNRGEAKET